MRIRLADGNLFADLPEGPASAEIVTAIVDRPEARIERIVSTGHTSPEAGWYDQDADEWVVVLQGGARIELEDGAEITLGPGDHVFLPAHRRHRVSWTDPAMPTVWLAVHMPHPNSGVPEFGQ